MYNLCDYLTYQCVFFVFSQIMQDLTNYDPILRSTIPPISHDPTQNLEFDNLAHGCVCICIYLIETLKAQISCFLCFSFNKCYSHHMTRWSKAYQDPLLIPNDQCFSLLKYSKCLIETSYQDLLNKTQELGIWDNSHPSIDL